MCVPAGGRAIGKATGGSLNPAMPIGIQPALKWKEVGFVMAALHAHYTILEFIGAVLIFAFSCVVRPREAVTEFKVHIANPLMLMSYALGKSSGVHRNHTVSMALFGEAVFRHGIISVMSEMSGGGLRYRCADGEGFVNKCIFWSRTVHITETLEPPRVWSHFQRKLRNHLISCPHILIPLRQSAEN